MKQHDFDNYEDYVEAQRSVTLRKVREDTKKKGHVRQFASIDVVKEIQDYHPHVVRKGLCHGVRCGDELNLFQEVFGGLWMGTEIVEELCDDKKILHRDFTDVDKEWIGAFDVIYSNSFDHARDPWKTMKAWLACLAEGGRLYVEWTPWSAKLGRGRNRADCLALTEEEHLAMWTSAGRVEEVIEVPMKNRSWNRKILVVL